MMIFGAVVFVAIPTATHKAGPKHQENEET